jgi:predicted acetyltransferase
LGHYYIRHGLPAATLLLTESGCVVGHLAIYEREIRIGNETLQAGLLGEIAVAADRRRAGLARNLVHEAHAHLQAHAIPFSILFAYEPRVYVSSGYRLMQNQMRFLDTDGQWKTFVYRGSMYAELLGRPWPDQTVDLCGPAV